MLIDRLAYNSSLRSINPLIKLLFSLWGITLCIWADSYAFSAAILFLMLSLIIFAGKTRARDVLHLITVPVSFIIIGAAAIAVSVNGADSLFEIRLLGVSLGISQSGLGAALRVTAKCLGSVSCMYFLSLTTPAGELFGLLRRSPIPGFIVEITELVYRYIFVLYDAAQRIRVAQDSRLGYGTLGASYRSTGLLAANLFMRAYRQAERTYTAMESRGYDGKIELAEEEREIKAAEALAAVLTAAALTAIAVICRRYGV